MKKLFIYPSYATENHYISIQEQAIRNSGVNVTYSQKNFLLTDYFYTQKKNLLKQDLL